MQALDVQSSFIKTIKQINRDFLSLETPRPALWKNQDCGTQITTKKRLQDRWNLSKNFAKPMGFWRTICHPYHYFQCLLTHPYISGSNTFLLWGYKFSRRALLLFCQQTPRHFLSKIKMQRSNISLLFKGLWAFLCFIYS